MPGFSKRTGRVNGTIRQRKTLLRTVKRILVAGSLLDSRLQLCLVLSQGRVEGSEKDSTGCPSAAAVLSRWRQLLWVRNEMSASCVLALSVPRLSNHVHQQHPQDREGIWRLPNQEGPVKKPPIHHRSSL